MKKPGPLAFVGGAEWKKGCEFDERLLEASQSNEVLVLPTAAAFEHPKRRAEAAEEWFSGLGAKTTVLDVLNRRDAEDPDKAEIARNARFIYLSDGSPLHLRSVIKDSALWDALIEAWKGGAVVAGSSAGGMIFGDPMVDPRGGAFTLGLGLVRKFAVVPHWEQWTPDKSRRMTQLMPSGTVVAEIEESTALIRWSDGTWEIAGKAHATLTLDHKQIDVSEIESNVEI